MLYDYIVYLTLSLLCCYFLYSEQMRIIIYLKLFIEWREKFCAICWISMIREWRKLFRDQFANRWFKYWRTKCVLVRKFNNFKGVFLDWKFHDWNFQTPFTIDTECQTNYTSRRKSHELFFYKNSIHHKKVQKCSYSNWP